MLADLSSREYADWEAFAQVEPIGEDRADLQAAVVASTVANVNRNARKKPQPFTYADFMPFLYRPKPNLSEQIKAAFRQIGGRDGQ